MLPRDQVVQAVQALQKYDAQKLRDEKSKSLFDGEPSRVLLQFALKLIPPGRRNPTKITLPHPFYTPDHTVCLFTKADKVEAVKLLESKGVAGITKVIPISKLRKKYKPFEAKRQLSSMYDIFLTDVKIYHLLPQLLGKKFYDKKKFPTAVNMRKSDLQSEIQSAITAVHFCVGRGSCISIPVGRVDFSCDQLVENVMSATDQVAHKVSTDNIQSIHVKTSDSIALPLVNCLPPAPSVIDVTPVTPGMKRRLEEDAEDEENCEVEEIEPVPVKKTKVTTKPKVSTKPKVTTKRVRGSVVTKKLHAKRKQKR